MSKKRPGIAPGLMLGFRFSAGFEATLLELPLRRRHTFHRRQPEQDTRDEVPFVTYQKKMPIAKRQAMGEQYLGPTRSSVRNVTVTVTVNAMDRGAVGFPGRGPRPKGRAKAVSMPAVGCPGTNQRATQAD